MPIPSGIPDHDGRPVPGLAEALAEIDRRYPGHPMRRALRAAAAYNFGDAVGWHREMQVLLDEFADEVQIRRADVDRLVLPPRRFVAVRFPRRGR